MATNEALAEYLALHHKGEANAVTSRELECSFQMRGSELRREINALRGDGIPICSFEGGYYYAATAEELERTIRQLRSRIKKIAFAERGLSSALPDYVDTITIPVPLEAFGDAGLLGKDLHIQVIDGAVVITEDTDDE